MIKGYRDNFDNEYLNKYEKIHKNRNKFYKYVILLINWWWLNFVQFYYCLIIHQRPLNENHCKLYNILMVFDGLSHDDKII